MAFKLEDGDVIFPNRVWEESDKIFSQCIACKWNFYGRAGCAAYPEGRIPMAILLKRHDHRQPYAGYGGIQFERDPNWNFEVDTTSEM